MLNDRLKYVVPVSAHNIERFVQKVIFKQDEKECSYKHNSVFMQEAIKIFKEMGEKNRFKVFARIRYHFDLSDSFILTRPSNLPLLEKESHKSAFYDLLLGKKTFTFASICFTDKVSIPKNAK
jgi:hypothetical protein